MPVSKDREKAIEGAISQIEREFGKGSIMRLGAKGRLLDVKVIPSGALPLDVALEIGGIPKGRITEIYGPEASGKTTLALHVVAEAQKDGGVAAFVDAEHALDPVYARNLGVKTEELLISQPDTGEQALEIAETLVRSGAVDVVVIDSVAALVPKAELEGDMGDSHVGLQARLMSQALRKLTGAVSKSDTALIFINQVRKKISTFGFGGPSETTTGGMALKFYSSVRLEIRHIASIKDREGKRVGSRVRVKVVKNKLAPPFREVELEILYGYGVSKEGCLIDMALDAGVIQKSGTWFSFGDMRLGQGKEKVRDFLKENPEVYSDIDRAVREGLGMVFSKEEERVDVEQAEEK